MPGFKSRGFFIEKPEDEEYPEPKTYKHKYVPISEAHDPTDDSWKRYGEGLGSYDNPDDYSGELADDRVELQDIEQKKSTFYFEGHYLDMDDPYDRAFYDAKKAEVKERENTKIQKEIENTSEVDKIGESRLDILRQPLGPGSGNDGSRSVARDRSKRSENLKTLKKSNSRKIERAYRGKLAKVKQDLVLGDTEDKKKYISKEDLHQDDISDFLDSHHEQFADTEDDFEEIETQYKSW